MIFILFGVAQHHLGPAAARALTLVAVIVVPAAQTATNGRSAVCVRRALRDRAVGSQGMIGDFIAAPFQARYDRPQ